MSLLNWDIFRALPGAPTTNFENLCRGIIQRQFGQNGRLVALSNQPGVEFHLKLDTDCSLGKSAEWFGFQCRWYDLPPARAIGSTRREKIKEALETTLRVLPGITSWVLWTRHTLTKSDQKWFYGLTKTPKLILYTSTDVENLLGGPALLLRETYFGELILRPNDLQELHDRSVARVAGKWVPEVHQPVDAEREIRRKLAEIHSWESLKPLLAELATAEKSIRNISRLPIAIKASVVSLADTAHTFAKALESVNAKLSRGDFGELREELAGRPEIPFEALSVCLRQMRSRSLDCALHATNTISDIKLARASLDDMATIWDTTLVAVLAPAGGGKTQLSAEITKATSERSAGLLLHGQDLGASDTLDEFTRAVTIQGKPVQSMELSTSTPAFRTRHPLVSLFQ
jgi:hypothetical protein